MTTITVAICQIDLRLDTTPFRIANPDEHTRLVEQCLDLADKASATHVVFPEYAFLERMRGRLETASGARVIIAGSHQNAHNHNETVVMVDGKSYSYSKVHLSPYEDGGTGQRVVPGNRNDVLVLAVKEAEPMSVLTCLDYHWLGRDVALNRTGSGDLVSLIFCPALNEEPDTFKVQANAVHDQRDDLYSVFCNAHSVGVSGRRPRVYAESSVFGIGDRATRETLLLEQRRDERFSNELIRAEQEAGVLVVELQVPYARHRVRSLEFTRNPVEYQFTPCSGIGDS